MIDAEQAILNIVLKDNSVLNGLELSVNDFDNTDHQTIYSIFGELEASDTPIDLVTVGDKLAKSGNINILGYLSTISGYVVPGNNLQTYVKQVKDKSIFQQYLSLGKKILSHSKNGHRSPQEYVEEAIEHLRSLQVDNNKERNISADIKSWIKSSSGIFSGSDIDRDISLSTKKEKILRKTILSQLVSQGIIKKITNRNNMFVKVEGDLEIIDPFACEPGNYFKIKWPFELERYVNIFPGNIGIVAGAKSAGKSAFMLNLALNNRDIQDVIYFSSEMFNEELRERIDKFNVPQKEWRKITFARAKVGMMADLMKPDSLNIIDYLEIYDNFWLVAEEINDIYSRLGKGVAIIAIQKDKGKDTGRGGFFSMEKSRIYLAMDNNILKIVDGKNRANPDINPNKLEFPYKLVQGCRFKYEKF